MCACQPPEWLCACACVLHVRAQEGCYCSLLLHNTHCITTAGVWAVPAIWRDATPTAPGTTHWLCVPVCVCALLCLFVSTNRGRVIYSSCTFLGPCSWRIKARETRVIHCCGCTACFAVCDLFPPDKYPKCIIVKMYCMWNRIRTQDSLTVPSWQGLLGVWRVITNLAEAKMSLPGKLSQPHKQRLGDP